MAKDEKTSNAEPMTHEFIRRPRLRNQPQVRAEVAAAEATTAPTPAQKEEQ